MFMSSFVNLKMKMAELQRNCKKHNLYPRNLYSKSRKYVYFPGKKRKKERKKFSSISYIFPYLEEQNLPPNANIFQEGVL